jgi:hypothetical protein
MVAVRTTRRAGQGTADPLVVLHQTAGVAIRTIVLAVRTPNRSFHPFNLSLSRQARYLHRFPSITLCYHFQFICFTRSFLVLSKGKQLKGTEEELGRRNGRGVAKARAVTLTVRGTAVYLVLTTYSVMERTASVASAYFRTTGVSGRTLTFVRTDYTAIFYGKICSK